MLSFGINVKHTGRSMLAEALITAKNIGSTFKSGGFANKVIENNALGNVIVTFNAIRSAVKMGEAIAIAKSGAAVGVVGATVAFAYEKRRLVAAVLTAPNSITTRLSQKIYRLQPAL